MYERCLGKSYWPVDTLIDPAWCDLTDDVVVEDLLQRIHAGEFFSTIIGTPCGTFSVARIRRPGVVDDGPPQMRDKERPEGIDGLAPGYAAQLEISNTLVKRTTSLGKFWWYQTLQSFECRRCFRLDRIARTG